MEIFRTVLAGLFVAVSSAAVACGALAAEHQRSVSPASVESNVALFSRSLNIPADLEKVVQLPFSFDTTNTRQTCEGTITDPTALRKFTGCLDRNWQTLLENLHDRPVEGLKVTSAKKLPDFAKNRFTDNRHLWMLTGWCNGDGVTYHFVFQGRKDNAHITKVLIDQEFIE